MPNLAISEDKKPPTDEELREAQVYEAIGEMIKRRDSLLKKFAVVLHGEVTVTGSVEQPVSISPCVQCRVVDRSRSFDLKAHYSVFQSRFESGNEVVKIGDQYKSRDDLFIGPYVTKPKDEKLSDWLDHNTAEGFDPYDDYLTGIGSIQNANLSPLIEGIVLKKYELTGTERGAGGRLISNWKFNANKNGTLDIRMEFDSSKEMMPVRVSRTNSLLKDYYEEIRFEWGRHMNTLVPTRISFASPDVNRAEKVSEVTFKCYWLIGDEVPDAIFTSEDHLAALLDHFGIVHSRMILGEEFNEVHVLPVDLYDDSKKKK